MSNTAGGATDEATGFVVNVKKEIDRLQQSKICVTTRVAVRE